MAVERLVDFSPRFVRYVDGGVETVLSLELAHGLEFYCLNREHRHRVHVWFAGKAPAAAAGPRWQIVGGRGLEDLSLHPSLDAGASCFHVFIHAGEIRRS